MLTTLLSTFAALERRPARHVAEAQRYGEWFTGSEHDLDVTLQEYNAEVTTGRRLC